MTPIYLDNAATTPTDPQVVDAMSLYWNTYFANASSTHSCGQQASVALDQARTAVSDFLVCEFSEITFTSGATESNNLLLQGYYRAFKKKYPGKPFHIVTTRVEHPSVREVVMKLEEEDAVSVSYVNPDASGVVSTKSVLDEITESTALVTCMYANNEVGSIMPIREIGKGIEKINEEREVPILFHTDATQALNYLNCDVRHLHVHALTASSHKIYGPKGVGILYLHSRFEIEPIMFGGEQEWTNRPGTVNTPALAGLSKAISLLQGADHEQEVKRISELKKTLTMKLQEAIPTVIVNGDVTTQLPSHVHMSISDVKGESAFLSLDMAGVCISLGSACAAGKVDDSYVLESMGIGKALRQNSLRLTLGRFTTKEDVDRAVAIFTSVYQQLKGQNG